MGPIPVAHVVQTPGTTATNVTIATLSFVECVENLSVTMRVKTPAIMISVHRRC